MVYRHDFGVTRIGKPVLAQFVNAGKVKIRARHAGSNGGTEYCLIWQDAATAIEFVDALHKADPKAIDPISTWGWVPKDSLPDSDIPLSEFVGIRVRGVNWKDTTAVDPVNHDGSLYVPS